MSSRIYQEIRIAGKDETAFLAVHKQFEEIYDELDSINARLKKLAESLPKLQ